MDLVGHIQKGAVATPNQEWMHQRGTLAEALEAVDQKFSRQGPGWFGLGCFSATGADWFGLGCLFSATGAGWFGLGCFAATGPLWDDTARDVKEGQEQRQWEQQL